MKLIRITNTLFATNASGVSVPVFEGGKDYPVDADTLRQVALRNGEEVEVHDEPVDAPAPDEPAPEAPAPVAAPAGKKSKSA
jgi:hypothetical protein